MQENHVPTIHSTTTSNPSAASLKLARLAQARGTFSLRRVPSRLGEGATRGEGTLRGLAQARTLLAQKELKSPRRQFEWGKLLIISLRRD